MWLFVPIAFVLGLLVGIVGTCNALWCLGLVRS